MQNAPDQKRQTMPLPGPESGPVPLPKAKEIGGPSGPEPTRHGDWEKAGRCIDF